MKNYVGSAIVTFDMEAYDTDDLKKRIMKQLGADLEFLDIEIDEIHSEGDSYYDYEDIFHEEELLGEHNR